MSLAFFDFWGAFGMQFIVAVTCKQLQHTLNDPGDAHVLIGLLQ